MREKLRQFMIGRYGTDGLNQFLSIASLVLLLIAIISRRMSSLVTSRMKVG